MKSFVVMCVVVVASLAVAGYSVYRLSVARGGVGAPAAGQAEAAALMARATALAEDELVRLNAAEMVYRNKVYVHTYTMEAFASNPARQYMKLYREFTGYEIEDIERTPSLLKPVKFLIRFDFDLVGTRGEGGNPHDPAVIRRVQGDHAFIVHGRESLTREYICDAGGRVVSEPPSPERPNIYSSPGTKHFGELMLEGPMGAAERD
jgi:hypothetical protein